MLVIITLLSLVLFMLWLKFRERDSRYSPPNPPVHPIFGNILALQKLDPIFHFALDSLTSKFGPVFKLRLFGEWKIFVTGFVEMKVRFYI